MAARTSGAFALGLALGAALLGVGLWASGAIVAAPPPWKKTVAVVVPPPVAALPAPAGTPLSEILSSSAAKIPPPPLPDPEPITAPPAEEHIAPTSTSPYPPGFVGPIPPPPGTAEADRSIPDTSNLPHLSVPLAGLDPKKIADTFHDARGPHQHDALDLMAPKGTPVMAVAQGNVAKLFTSKDGGLTVYQFDDSRTYCFYYAHLDRYAPGLQDGTLLRPGQVLGYVGSTGNASPKAPHLHFALFKLGPEKKWWQGTAIDPALLFR